MGKNYKYKFLFIINFIFLFFKKNKDRSSESFIQDCEIPTFNALFEIIYHYISTRLFIYKHLIKSDPRVLEEKLSFFVDRLNFSMEIIRNYGHFSSIFYPVLYLEFRFIFYMNKFREKLDVNTNKYLTWKNKFLIEKEAKIKNFTPEISVDTPNELQKSFEFKYFEIKDEKPQNQPYGSLLHSKNNKKFKLNLSQKEEKSRNKYTRSINLANITKYFFCTFLLLLNFFDISTSSMLESLWKKMIASNKNEFATQLVDRKSVV